jgi:hypothetical protein
VGLGCAVPASKGTFDLLLSGQNRFGFGRDTSTECELSFDDGCIWTKFRLALFRVLHIALPHDVRLFQLAHRG